MNLKIIVLRRGDLSKSKSIDEVELIDACFRYNNYDIQTSSLIIYIDEFGNSKVLKDRYSKEEPFGDIYF